jgi:hypothetical protein
LETGAADFQWGNASSAGCRAGRLVERKRTPRIGCGGHRRLQSVRAITSSLGVAAPVLPAWLAGRRTAWRWGCPTRATDAGERLARAQRFAAQVAVIQTVKREFGCRKLLFHGVHPPDMVNLRPSRVPSHSRHNCRPPRGRVKPVVHASPDAAWYGAEPAERIGNVKGNGAVIVRESVQGDTVPVVRICPSRTRFRSHTRFPGISCGRITLTWKPVSVAASPGENTDDHDAEHDKRDDLAAIHWNPLYTLEDATPLSRRVGGPRSDVHASAHRVFVTCRCAGKLHSACRNASACGARCSRRARTAENLGLFGWVLRGRASAELCLQ